MRSRVRLALVLTALVSGGVWLRAQQDYRVKTKAPRTAEVERILARTDASQDQWLGEQDYEAINAIIQKDKRGLPWPPGLLERFQKHHQAKATLRLVSTEVNRRSWRDKEAIRS